MPPKTQQPHPRAGKKARERGRRLKITNFCAHEAKKRKNACVGLLGVLLVHMPKILSRGQNVENQKSPGEMFSTTENVDIVENSLAFPGGKPQNSWFFTNPKGCSTIPTIRFVENPQTRFFGHFS